MVAFTPHMIRSGASRPPLLVRELRMWLYAEALDLNVEVDSSTLIAKCFSNVPPAEVAVRLGHSVDMFRKIYAGVCNGEREWFNTLIVAELGASRVS
jgi:hypothetical protein